MYLQYCSVGLYPIFQQPLAIVADARRKIINSLAFAAFHGLPVACPCQGVSQARRIVKAVGTLTVVGTPFSERRTAYYQLSAGTHVVVVETRIFYLGGQRNVLVAVAIARMHHKMIHTRLLLHLYPHVKPWIVEHPRQDACRMIADIEHEVARILRRIAVAIRRACHKRQCADNDTYDTLENSITPQ